MAKAKQHRQGTVDHDGNGEMGGSLPVNPEARLEALEKALERLEAVMRRNGWTL